MNIIVNMDVGADIDVDGDVETATRRVVVVEETRGRPIHTGTD